ncbi:peptide/nickel transport system ATP-binding protein [Paramicrobacterium agarici]|uniref:Peptide/nickel transport system ATP-binding protein n=2 Tax=Paramicrobacterium agarici TaxID=630514 RepID=A0A2A9DWE0_9MICO|nr:ATP-binding cassette domain-containing protein [Microbacterium agarici]PFG30894.1 peptide/nickel transport system ATP-binding protein [Microbacterium agarici]
MTTPLMRLCGLTRDYVNRRDTLFAPRSVTHALRSTDLEIPEGASLGIIGESGSGKSTLVRLMLALDTPTSGHVEFRERPVARGRRAGWFRRETGIVFQDPYASLDPRMTVGRIVSEPLSGLRIAGDHRARVLEVLGQVGLDGEMADRYPHEFSGGQRQRIALARAIVHEPCMLVGDEPVSALDVTVRAQILELLADLKAQLGLTLVLVSHDIGIVRDLCENVAVMTDGRIVEKGDTAEVLARPQHPYTTRLLDAVPALDMHEND